MIVPRLWLGNRFASMDPAFLSKNGITVVFNCTKDLPFHPSVPQKYRVPVDDNLQAQEIQNLRTWAPEIMVKLMHEYQSGKTILVHCAAGMQRSAAVVAMFLVTTTRKSPDTCMSFIRSKRAIAFFPSANFGPAIKGFDQDIQTQLR